MAEVDTFGLKVRSFLHFCQAEKGLSVNTLEAYRRDLAGLGQWLGKRTWPLYLLTICGYISIICGAVSLSNRSIARQVTTLRGFFWFPLGRRRNLRNPAELLAAPKIGASLPKYLDHDRVGQLIDAPDSALATGLRDHAMLDLLYATGLRVSELIKLRVADLDEFQGVVRVIGKGGKQRLVPVGKRRWQPLKNIASGSANNCWVAVSARFYL